MQIPEWVRPGVWGAVIGAAAITIVGFSAGWVVTSGTAQETADRQAEQAVIASLTPVCVAKFKGQPQEVRKTHLVALENESSWKRGDYVEAQGWATFAGTTEPNDEVAEACATELMKLAGKQS